MSQDNQEKRPRVAVSALIIQEGKLLLARRKEEPNKGLWAPPGGLVEVGETVEEGLVREVLEETGLHVKAGPITVISELIQKDKGEGPSYHYIIVNMRAEVVGGTLKAGGDSDAVEWVSFADLPKRKLAKGVELVLSTLASPKVRSRGLGPDMDNPESEKTEAKNHNLKHGSIGLMASLFVEAPLLPFVISHLLRFHSSSLNAGTTAPSSLSNPVWLETQMLWVAIAFALGFWQGVRKNRKYLESLIWAYVYTALAFAASSLIASVLLSSGLTSLATVFRFASVSLGLATASPLVFLATFGSTVTSGYPMIFFTLDILAGGLLWLGHRLGSRVVVTS